MEIDRTELQGIPEHWDGMPFTIIEARYGVDGMPRIQVKCRCGNYVYLYENSKLCQHCSANLTLAFTMGVKRLP